tara:strand:- start:1513 stop:1833 length:321 start_codon:yes stop_codon:yes gene_type:complete
MGKQNDTLIKNIEEYDKSKQKLDRNTIIITALANYYDYNDLSQEEGREVVKIIMDIEKYTRMIKFDNILDDLMDIISDNTSLLGENTYEEDLKDAIYDYFNKLKNK